MICKFFILNKNSPTKKHSHHHTHVLFVSVSKSDGSSDRVQFCNTNSGYFLKLLSWAMDSVYIYMQMDHQFTNIPSILLDDDEEQQQATATAILTTQRRWLSSTCSCIMIIVRNWLWSSDETKYIRFEECLTKQPMTRRRMENGRVENKEQQEEK